MGALFYNIGIRFYFLFILLFSLFNAKARLWVKGRRNWRTHYAADWKLKNPANQPCIWVHCASLGEFEQGRPVIESLKKEYPDLKIVLTFFSPSGYEIRKQYALANYVCYLPIDTRANALQFIKIFQPALSIFVKYEFWFHYLNTLHQKQIPTLLISAIFRENQIFFKWYGKLFRRLLFQFQHIFIQNQASANLLQLLGLQNFTVVGDTRIDRVLQIAKEAPAFPLITTFAKGHQILVVGSSWQPDEEILFPFINQQLPENWKVIIAPHDIAASHIQQIEHGLSVSHLRYSKANLENVTDTKVLIIDNVGMLSALYRYGRLAYIGGGFGTGIHNTLEPIAFGLPVLFGPKFQKFEEALQLTKQGGAFVIQNTADFQEIFAHLQDLENYNGASTIANQYVVDNQGATEKIVDFIRKKYHTKV